MTQNFCFPVTAQNGEPTYTADQVSRLVGSLAPRFNNETIPGIIADSSSSVPNMFSYSENNLTLVKDLDAVVWKHSRPYFAHLESGSKVPAGNNDTVGIQVDDQSEGDPDNNISLTTGDSDLPLGTVTSGSFSVTAPVINPYTSTVYLYDDSWLTRFNSGTLTPGLNVYGNSKLYVADTDGKLYSPDRTASTTWAVPYGGGRIDLERVGKVVSVHGNVKFTQSGDFNYSHNNERIPVGYRPVHDNTTIIFTHTGGGDGYTILVAQDGSTTSLGNPRSAYSPCTGSWLTADPWPSN